MKKEDVISILTNYVDKDLRIEKITVSPRERIHLNFSYRQDIIIQFIAFLNAEEYITYEDSLNNFQNVYLESKENSIDSMYEESNIIKEIESLKKNEVMFERLIPIYEDRLQKVKGNLKEEIKIEKEKAFQEEKNRFEKVKKEIMEILILRSNKLFFKENLMKIKDEEVRNAISLIVDYFDSKTEELSKQIIALSKNRY